MHSSRLPGKAIAEANGKQLIVHTIERLKQCKLIDQVVLATSNSPDNEILRAVALSQEIDCPRIVCDENDVLTRYKMVADLYDADVIVRITGDCPLINPAITDRVIGSLGEHEFSTNVLHRSYAKGMDTEVMTKDCLDKLDKLVTDDRREHVTVYIYSHAHQFDIIEVVDKEDNSEIVLCVDYPEDLEQVREILEWIGERKVPYDEMIRYVRKMHEPTARGVPVGSWSATGSYRETRT
jgi:spore coat polysaccharide biosynthesis protein SpsF